MNPHRMEEKNGSSSAPPGWLLFPREHGAWGMVGLPFLAATAIAPGDPFRLGTAAAALAVLSVFLLRDPLVTLRRARSAPNRPEAATQRLLAKRSLAICLGGLALSGTILLMTLPAFWILLLGTAGLALVVGSVLVAMERVQREITSQLLSVAGLTASCLPAYLAVNGDLDWVSITIWFMSAGHSIAAVLVVRARLETILLRRRSGAASGPGRFFRAAVVWQTGLWISLAALAWIGYPSLALPFLLPSVLHVWELVQFRRGAGLQLSLHRVGWSQLAASALFYTVLVFLFRLQSLT
ncbi:MAG TPA: YwiC-like family protein [Anaerolineales bacterium]